MKLTLSQLARGLRTNYGGCTLWLGAGVTRALIPNSPLWADLVDELEEALAIDCVSSLSYPERLDRICDHAGFPWFRRQLRTRLIDGLDWDGAALDVLQAQARIGARASVVVSFNIQRLSVLPFLALHGGPAIRTYHWADQRKNPRPMVAEGRPASIPVIFPHGALDVSGECVMTASEYAAHGQGDAFESAVNMGYGGDILILGMSLDDAYLRDAIVRRRRSIRRIFWVTTGAPRHETWRRQTDIHRIEAPSHDALWYELGSCFDDSLDFKSDVQRHWSDSVAAHARYVAWYENNYLGDHLTSLLSREDLQLDDRREEFWKLAHQYESIGLELPRRLQEQVDGCLE